jgi:hypothetical protein
VVQLPCKSQLQLSLTISKNQLVQLQEKYEHVQTLTTGLFKLQLAVTHPLLQLHFHKYCVELSAISDNLQAVQLLFVVQHVQLTILLEIQLTSSLLVLDSLQLQVQFQLQSVARLSIHDKFQALHKFVGVSSEFCKLSLQHVPHVHLI